MATSLLFCTLFFTLIATANDIVVKTEENSIDWKYLVSDSEKTTYILKDSAKHSGDEIIEVWYLWDYKFQQIGQADRKFISMKQLSQFSCKKHTAQLLSVTMYENQMANGRTVATANFKDQPWLKITALSSREVIFKHLCAKK